MKSYRRLPGISYEDHITNTEVSNKNTKANVPRENLLTKVKKRKLKWYGHVTRSSGLAKFYKGQSKDREGEKDKEGKRRIASPNGEKRR